MKFIVILLTAVVYSLPKLNREKNYITKRGICPSKFGCNDPSNHSLFNIIQVVNENVCAEQFMLGQTLNNKYLVKKRIGTGTFSHVYLASYNNQDYALKCVLDNDDQDFDTEATLMKKLDHPNVVKLIDSFTEYRTLFLVMEMCDFSLSEIIPLNEYDAKLVFLQLLDAIEYIHSQKVFHADIKPDNIMISNSTGYCSLDSW